MYHKNSNELVFKNVLCGPGIALRTMPLFCLSHIAMKRSLPFYKWGGRFWRLNDLLNVTHLGKPGLQHWSIVVY